MFRTHLAADHKSVNPLDHTPVDGDHCKRQDVIRHTECTLVDEYSPRDLRAPSICFRAGSIDRIGDKNHSRCLDDVPVLHSSLAADRGGIGCNRVRRILDRAQADDKEPSPVARRITRDPA
jgi:hypothetical protein